MPEESIVGTWTLRSTRAWDDNGEALPAPFGPIPRGLVAFYDNARMMCVLTDGRAGTETSSTREYSTYTGSYTFNGSTLVTQVDGSVDASRVGGEQVRAVRFEAGYLYLQPPSRPRHGGTEHRELKWRRIG